MQVIDPRSRMGSDSGDASRLSIRRDWDDVIWHRAAPVEGLKGGRIGWRSHHMSSINPQPGSEPRSTGVSPGGTRGRSNGGRTRTRFFLSAIQAGSGRLKMKRVGRA